MKKRTKPESAKRKLAVAWREMMAAERAFIAAGMEYDNAKAQKKRTL